MHFNMKLNKTIKINDLPINISKSHKYLGVIFATDKKNRITFKDHFLYLHAKCVRRFNLLKSLASTKWGISRSLLRTAYIAFIYQLIFYGSEITSHQPQHWKSITVLHNHVIKFILGTHYSARNDNCNRELNLLPLEKYRHYKILNFVDHCLSISDHPLNGSCIPTTPDNNNLHTLPNKWSLFINSIRIRYNHCPSPSYLCSSTILPWEILNWSFFVRSLPATKSTFNPSFLHAFAQKTLDITYTSRPNSINYFTDGSRLQNRTSAAFFLTPSPTRVEHSSSIRLPDNSSILTAELTAIFLATQHHASHFSDEPLTLFTDSLSAIHALQKQYPSMNHHLISLIKENISFLSSRGTSSHIVWIPSHSNIRHNDSADALAKSALEFNDITKITFDPISHHKRANKTLVENAWYHHLYSLNAISTNWHHDCTNYLPFPNTNLDRASEIALTHIRMNIRDKHSTINNILRLCTYCGQIYTSEHYFLCDYGTPHRLTSGLTSLHSNKFPNATGRDLALSYLIFDRHNLYKSIFKYINLFPPQIEIFNHRFIALYT